MGEVQERRKRGGEEVEGWRLMGRECRLTVYDKEWKLVRIDEGTKQRGRDGDWLEVEAHEGSEERRVNTVRWRLEVARHEWKRRRWRMEARRDRDDRTKGVESGRVRDVGM